MAELGLLGANLPEEFGCAGLNNVAYGLIMQELERGDSGIRSFASVQGALVMYPSLRLGTEERKKRWLPALAHGQAVGCSALAEPTSVQPRGDDHHREGNQRRLGAERFRGCRDHQRFARERRRSLGKDWRPARSHVDSRVHRPDRHKGFSARDQKGKLYARASDTSELILEDVHLPKDALLPKSGGLKSARCRALRRARYGIAWGAVGAQSAPATTRR